MSETIHNEYEPLTVKVAIKKACVTKDANLTIRLIQHLRKVGLDYAGIARLFSSIGKISLAEFDEMMMEYLEN